MPRLMVIYDIHVDTPSGRIGWAYWRRALALQKYAPPEWKVDIFRYKDVPWDACGQYDLIFNIEYAGINRKRVKGHLPHPNVPLVVSFNSDGNRRQHFWDQCRRDADFTVFNNLHAFDCYKRHPRTCCISNGVDTDVFRVTTPIGERPHKAIFAGSTGPTKGKGWPEIFWPLEKVAAQYGFETDFRPVDEISEQYVMPTEKTVEWYNSASYVLCASISEGTPNAVSEAVACGCVAVSVPVGNILEWGRQGQNCVIVDRTVDSFIRGLELAREKRESLSAAGVEVFQKWAYGPPGHRARYYFALFDKIIAKGVDSVKPFYFGDIQPGDI